jgi:hypothetical protein
MDPFKGASAFDNKISIKKEYNDRITNVVKIYETKLESELEKML